MSTRMAPDPDMSTRMAPDPESLNDLIDYLPHNLCPREELLTKDESIVMRSSVIGRDIERGSIEKPWQVSTSKGSLSRGGLSLLRIARGWENKSKEILGYLSWLFLAIAIQLCFGLGGWAFPDGRPACSNSNMSEETSGKVKNRSMCLLSETLDSGVPILRFLSAFILGGFVASSVHLWLVRRTAYCALCGATRNLLINLCSIVSKEQDKNLLSRWAILGYELAVLKGRGLIDSDIGKSYLEKRHLVSSGEWDAMVDGDRHTTVWFWIQVKVEKLMQENEISHMSFQTICQAVTLSRDKANDLMSYIDRSQPPPYVFVCGLLVNTNLAMYTISSGFKWAIWMYDADGGIWKEPRMYADALIVFLCTAMYGMLFDVCAILHNPFGPREIDVEHYKVGRGIRKLAKSLAKGTNPPTMTRRLGTSEIEAQATSFCEDELEEHDNRISQLVKQPSTRDMRKRGVSWRA
eukprot:106340_1